VISSVAAFAWPPKAACHPAILVIDLAAVFRPQGVHVSRGVGDAVAEQHELFVAIDPGIVVIHVLPSMILIQNGSAGAAGDSFKEPLSANMSSIIVFVHTCCMGATTAKYYHVELSRAIKVGFKAGIEILEDIVDRLQFIGILGLGLDLGKAIIVVIFITINWKDTGHFDLEDVGEKGSCTEHSFSFFMEDKEARVNSIFG
jgi:hypothetical protein